MVFVMKFYVARKRSVSHFRTCRSNTETVQFSLPEKSTIRKERAQISRLFRSVRLRYHHLHHHRRRRHHSHTSSFRTVENFRNAYSHVRVTSDFSVSIKTWRSCLFSFPVLPHSSRRRNIFVCVSPLLRTACIISGQGIGRVRHDADSRTRTHQHGLATRPPRTIIRIIRVPPAAAVVSVIIAVHHAAVRTHTRVVIWSADVVSRSLRPPRAGRRRAAESGRTRARGPRVYFRGPHESPGRGRAVGGGKTSGCCDGSPEHPRKPSRASCGRRILRVFHASRRRRTRRFRAPALTRQRRGAGRCRVNELVTARRRIPHSCSSPDRLIARRQSVVPRNFYFFSTLTESHTWVKRVSVDQIRNGHGS